MKKSLLIVWFLHLVLFSFTQDHSSNDFSYEVHTIYPPLSMTKEKLKEAQTLLDLNKHYKPSWIKEYFSVEVSASYQGKLIKALSKNDTLNQAQKDILYQADVGTDISVKVQYLPNNNLVDNEKKEFDFKFMVNPEREATYIGGQQRLYQYLKEHAINKIPKGIFEGYDLAVIKFTINEEGEVIEPHIFWNSKDEKIDELLLITISKMPCWKPAAYANGLKIKQEFAFMVGNKANCAVHLLNIHQD